MHRPPLELLPPLPLKRKAPLKEGSRCQRVNLDMWGHDSRRAMCSRLALHMATSPTRGVPCLPHIHPPPWQQAVFGFFECLSQGLLTFIYIYMSPFQSARGDIFLRLGGVRRSNPGWGWGWGWESGQMGPRTRVLLYSGLNGENSSTPKLTMGSLEPPPPGWVGNPSFPVLKNPQCHFN